MDPLDVVLKEARDRIEMLSEALKEVAARVLRNISTHAVRFEV
jgi:hypothetical protein